jgi:hypothetical protein
MIITGWLDQRIENARNADVLEAGCAVYEWKMMAKFIWISIVQTAALTTMFGLRKHGLKK